MQNSRAFGVGSGLEQVRSEVKVFVVAIDGLDIHFIHVFASPFF